MGADARQRRGAVASGLEGESVTRISMAPMFVDALARLDAGSVKRAAGFLDKLVSEPERTGFNLEALHDARDEKVRSVRVSHDLRAILREDGDDVLLLYVGHHDDAYAWARRHRVEAGPGPALRVVHAPHTEETAAEKPLASTEDRERWSCALSGDGGLCQPADAARPRR